MTSEKGVMPSLDEVVDNYETFGRPPNRSEKVRYFGKALLRKFKEQFMTLSWNIPNYATISFHTLLGAMPNVRNIKIRVGNNYEDCRIHSFLLMESGAGKSGGYGYTHKIAEELGLNFRSTGDLTNPSLCGTIKPGEKGERGEVVPGYLHPDFDGGNPVDIFASSEASQIIDTQDNAYLGKDAITNLQKSMNRMGSVDNVLEKKVGSSRRIINFNTSATLYFTSYPPERLFHTITKMGLLQRMILLYVPVSLQDKYRVGMKHAELLGDDSVKSIEDDMGEIVDAMDYINDYYAGVKDLVLTDQAKRVLKKRVIPAFFKPLIGISSETMHELKKFTTRYQVIGYKLAWHHAIMRLSRKVEARDMAYAKGVIMPIFNSLIAFMESEFRPSKGKVGRSEKERSAIKRAYLKISKGSSKRNPWVLKSSLMEQLEDELQVTPQASRHILQKHLTLFKNVKDKKGRRVMKLRDGK